VGQYVDLLKSVPRVKRDVNSRATDKSWATRSVAKSYGEAYFDGARKYGYGGYKYDGRWQQVARDIREHYDLLDFQRVLDVGCAKGFLVKDLWDTDLMAFGIDVSDYALKHCPDDVIGFLHHGTAAHLPFPDDSFDLVVSINMLHNLPRGQLIEALKEITRVSCGPAFVQVDSYRNDVERRLFEDWVLTAETHGTPDFWLALFAEAGYDGDYAWTIVEQL